MKISKMSSFQEARGHRLVRRGGRSHVWRQRAHVHAGTRSGKEKLFFKCIISSQPKVFCIYDARGSWPQFSKLKVSLHITASAIRSAARHVPGLGLTHAAPAGEGWTKSPC